jgi:small subunit ribosomal protein S10
MTKIETPGTVESISKGRHPIVNHWEPKQEAIEVAVKEKIRIRLKSYDHQLIDQAAEKIVETQSAPAPCFPDRFRSRRKRRS